MRDAIARHAQTRGSLEHLALDYLTVGAFAILFIRVYGGSWRVALIIAGLAEVFVFAVFDWLLEVFWPVPYLFATFIENWI